MQRTREFWNAFRNFAILFSFIMNFVLLVILLFVVLLIFQIKNGIAEPLLQGLHSNFVGLNEAKIETEVQVNDTIPIDFDLPVSDSTDVYLTEEVVIENVPAFFAIEGGGGTIRGTVDIRLPAETRLPIRLSLLVPVEQTIPVTLNVPVNIPLSETQLTEPFTNLRDLLEPYVRIVDNLPDNWSDVPGFAGDAMSGDVNLLGSTDYTRRPWKGFGLQGQPGEQAATPSAEPSGQETPPATETPVAPIDGSISPTATWTPTPPDFNPTPTFTPFGFQPTPTPAP
jgi:hypothetical protein